MKAILVLFCFVSALLVAVNASTPRSQAKLTSLPGLNPFPTNFDQYTGYVTVDDQDNSNMFYWFATSQNNPATDPVVLWMQGGPGCSGLGGGLLQENGPFFPNPTSFSEKQASLRDSFYSWNRIANVIYIESPIGVGFSYADNSRAYRTNDNATAVLNYKFLQKFFQIYNDFADNEFWITGESYGGVYIPTLAYQIMTGGQNAKLEANLKRGGLMLGNPVTNCGGSEFAGKRGVLYMNTQVNLYFWHAMASPRAYQQWVNAQCDKENPPSYSKCEGLYSEISAAAGFLEQPTSEKELFLQRPEDKRRSIQEIPGAVNPDCLYYSYCTGNVTIDFNTAENPTCFSIPDQISAYLNRKDVQAAINAKERRWSECSNRIEYSRNAGSLIPYLQQLFTLAPTMRVLYYSGDIDIATVPFAQTQRCLDTLNSPIKDVWRTWVVNKEVAGYVEVYDQFTYATLKGAGHEAPGFQPAAGYVLFSHFLNNQTLPKS